MSKEMGAGGRLDIFLDSDYNNITNLYRVTFSVNATAITKDPV